MWYTLLSTSFIIIPVTVLLAEGVDLTGGSGWVGTGLLGAVLSWLLLKHLPSKDQQLKEVLDKHYQVEEQQRNTHIQTQKEQRVEFKETLDAMLKHNQEQVNGLGQALKQDFQSLQKSVEALSDILLESRHND